MIVGVQKSGTSGLSRAGCFSRQKRVLMSVFAALAPHAPLFRPPDLVDRFRGEPFDVEPVEDQPHRRRPPRQMRLAGAGDANSPTKVNARLYALVDGLGTLVPALHDERLARPVCSRIVRLACGAAWPPTGPRRGRGRRPETEKERAGVALVPRAVYHAVCRVRAAGFDMPGPGRVMSAASQKSGERGELAGRGVLLAPSCATLEGEGR